MKTAIIYKTSTGSTKRYAKILAEQYGFDLLTFKEAEDKGFDDYERYIVSSGTYAGRMPLTKFIKRNWDKLENKKIIALAVGVAPANNAWSKFSYKLIPGKIRDKVTYFKIPGQVEDKPEKELKENLKIIHDSLK